MTKKQIAKLAEVIKDFNQHEQTEPFTLEQVSVITNFCSAQNAQFDPAKFLAACGVK